MKTAALAHTQKFAAVAIITGKKNLFFFFFFKPENMSSVRIAWAPQRADRLVMRCSGLKSVMQQD